MSLCKGGGDARLSRSCRSTYGLGKDRERYPPKDKVTVLYRVGRESLVVRGEGELPMWAGLLSAGYPIVRNSVLTPVYVLYRKFAECVVEALAVARTSHDVA